MQPRYTHSLHAQLPVIQGTAAAGVRVTEPCMHDLAEQAGHGAQTYQLPEGC